MAGGRQAWFRNVGLYTIAGGTTSILVGAAFGLLGSALSLSDRPAGDMLWIVIAVAVVAFLREIGVIRLPVPQLRRQTRGMWSRSYGGSGAAVLWGLDIGLLFSTWLTYSGAWVLVALAIVSGAPGAGAALFAAYWLGRAASVWIAPLLMARATDTPLLLGSIAGKRRLFQLIHATAILWTIAALSAVALGVGTV